MQVSSKKIDNTSVELTIKADENDLADMKRAVFNELRPKVKADGFRPGKAPDKVVEQQLGSETVHSEFLDRALSRLYSQAVGDEKLQIIGVPEVKLTSFVPYSGLTFTAVTEVMPEIKLPDYKKFKVDIKAEKPTQKHIDDVLEQMRRRLAEKKDVNRSAKDGDEVWIDFAGKDPKGEDVKGASGEDFPVIIGSNTFIPGFEEELVGLKAGDKKSFDLTFPKDYHATTLRGAKVTFEVSVKKVQEIVLPSIDEAFVAKASPFKTMPELKADIEKQLEHELHQQADRKRRESVVKQLVEGATIPVPPKLVEKVMGELKAELKKHLEQQGMNEEMYYVSQKTTAEDHEKSEIRPAAESRVKASLALSEVAKAEQISLSSEELDSYITALKERYKDNQHLLDDLDKPQVREDVAMQVLTERTIDKLLSYTKKA